MATQSFTARSLAGKSRHVYLHRKSRYFSILQTISAVTLYVLFYVANVKREEWTVWMGGFISVYHDYRVFPEFSRQAFYPVHLIDAYIIRPHYWKRFPDPAPPRP